MTLSVDFILTKKAIMRLPLLPYLKTIPLTVSFFFQFHTSLEKSLCLIK